MIFYYEKGMIDLPLDFKKHTKESLGIIPTREQLGVDRFATIKESIRITGI